MRHRFPATELLVAIPAIAIFVTSCSPGGSAESLSHTSHVHNVEISGSTLYAGTHEGLYALGDDGTWSRRGPSFDVMGLAEQDGQLFASGHPGEGLDAPDPIGIIRSDDGAESWTNHALSGEVDFHLLEASEESFIGVAANYGVLLRSMDAGQTWTSVDAPALTDLSVHPANPRQVAVISQGKLMISTDAGASFQPTRAPDNLQLVDWSEGSLLLTSADHLFVAATPEGPFTQLAPRFPDMTDVAHFGDMIAVLSGHSVHLSRDGGASFTQY